MRTLWLVLLVGGLAWGAWTVLGDHDDHDRSLVPDVPEAPAEPENQVSHHVATHGTLVVTVRTRTGRLPRSTQAGYRLGEREFLKPVDREGRVIFTAAPVGRLVALARAEGHTEETQSRFVTAGLRTDVILTLKQTDPDAAPK